MTAALLICGEYTSLQDTRAEVLRLAGFSVETVVSPEAVEERLRQKRYALLLICESLGQARVEMLKKMAAAAGVPTYSVAALTPAEVLIADVKTRVPRRLRHA